MDKEKESIERLLKSFIKKANKILDIEKVLFFGSRARGDFRRKSDLDIVIISKDFEKVPYYQRSPKLYLLWNYPNGIEIDIICLTPEEFAIKSKQISIAREALKEGIEIR